MFYTLKTLPTVVFSRCKTAVPPPTVGGEEPEPEPVYDPY